MKLLKSRQEKLVTTSTNYAEAAVIAHFIDEKMNGSWFTTFFNCQEENEKKNTYLSENNFSFVGFKIIEILNYIEKYVRYWHEPKYENV